jgi:hypothetical protein
MNVNDAMNDSERILLALGEGDGEVVSSSLLFNVHLQLVS